MSSSPSSSNPSIPEIRAGDGRIAVEFDQYRGHTFSQLSSTYPLKLLSPRSSEDSVAIVYVLSYGGGLVGGDEIELEVGVREGASLMLLSQVPIAVLGAVKGGCSFACVSAVLTGFHESF
jgi:urease accessory protein